jgi:hypothetical protein
LLSFCHSDERRLDVHRERGQGVDDLEHELCRDVSRAQVDDPETTDVPRIAARPKAKS